MERYYASPELNRPVGAFAATMDKQGLANWMAAAVADEADAEVPAAGHGAGHGSQPGLFGKGGGGEQCDGQGHGSGYKVCTHGWNLQRLGFAIHSGTVRRPRWGNRPF